MSFTNEPDYSNYSLDELRELARRVRNAGDADLRWRLKVEMARREKEEDSQRRSYSRFFSFQRDEPRRFQRWLFDNESEPRDYRWLFDHDETPRTADEIFLWWADRRQFWSRSLLLVSGCGIVSYFSILLASGVLRDGFNLNAVSNSLLRVSAISVWACIVVLIIFLMVSNVVYFVFVAFDVVISAILRFLDWRWSVFLFCLVLCLGLVVAALPCLSLVYALATKR